MRHTEHTLDSAHGATDTGSDGAAHDTADRTRGAVALIGAFLRATHDALRMGRVRDCQQRQRAGGSGKNPTSRQTGRCHSAPDLGCVHLNSLKSGTDAAGGWGQGNAEAAEWLRFFSGELENATRDARTSRPRENVSGKSPAAPCLRRLSR
jgi:hypothetical protein